MKRRDFVKNTALGAIGVPFVIEQFKYNTIGKEMFSYGKSAEDRVLILIRLNGGNDGLNTIVPMDGYDNLVIQRPNIVLPQASILDLGVSNLGMHPSMTGMKNMFDDGKMSIIQNVGYPQQNRSHFKSMEIWSNAIADTNGNTGWLGRHLENEAPGFPDGYPNATDPDPFAISMGYEVSSTCQGLVTNFSVAVNDPNNMNQLSQSIDNFENSYYGDHLEFISTIIDQSNAYATQVTAAVGAGNSMSSMYDMNNNMAVQLQNVAKMISGGLQTKIYILNINGFDTHDAQADVTDATLGTHADLLKTVSDAVAAFQDDLSLLGLEDRVIGMTFSEFGRQVASNASIGTDHGDAAPMFLFGSCLNNQVLGMNPVISDTITSQAGIPFEYDFRNIYASILKDWFLAPETQVQAMFEQTVNFIPLANTCNNFAGVDENDTAYAGKVYPNPSRSQVTLEFNSGFEDVSVGIYDATGRLVKELFSKSMNQDVHKVPVDISDLNAGTYRFLILKDSGKETISFVKIEK